MKMSRIPLIFLFLLLLPLWGCQALLPSTKVTVISQWQDFDKAKDTYERIVSGKTTIADLRHLGFNPFTDSNVRIITATDVANIFMSNPSIRIDDLDPGVQLCIRNKVRCSGYQIAPSIIEAHRVGNFWLDLFTFRRHTVNTGWEFRGLIIIVDNTVTYKDPPGGRPIIRTEQIDVKPLGPFQEFGTMLVTGAQTLIR